MAYKKIKVQFPDGRIECLSNVSETYRNAIQYIGLEDVRALGIMRNSINIVSTQDEIEKSLGKQEKAAINRIDPSTKLCICTQFGTEIKYNFLKEINERLSKNLKISLLDAEEEDTTLSIAEEEFNKEIREGLLKEYHATRYERNPTARRLCLSQYSHIVCQICGFDFEKTYGKRDNADPYIEIHHINPHASTSAKKGEHKVDCSKDLIPVCANCHRMLHHYKKGQTLHPSELKKILEEQKGHRNYS